MRRLRLDEGRLLISYARNVLESHFAEVEGFKVSKRYEALMEEKPGLFLTIKTYPKGYLRGCMGYLEGVAPLREMVKEVATLAAFRDPRFPPVTRSELGSITLELSILPPLDLIRVENPLELPKFIEVGRDGLVVERGYLRGLLLPQVPVEEHWNEREFLANTCIKAGLLPDAWLDRGTRVYRFTAQIFHELEPKGRVERRSLRAELRRRQSQF